MSGRRSKKEPPFVEMAVHAVVVVVFSSAAREEEPKRAAVRRRSRDRDTIFAVGWIDGWWCGREGPEERGSSLDFSLRLDRLQEFQRNIVLDCPFLCAHCAVNGLLGWSVLVPMSMPMGMGMVMLLVMVTR